MNPSRPYLSQVAFRSTMLLSTTVMLGALAVFALTSCHGSTSTDFWSSVSAANSNALKLAKAVRARALKTHKFDDNVEDYAKDFGGAIPLNPCVGDVAPGYSIMVTGNSAIVTANVGTKCGRWSPMVQSLTL